jgi:hypothetical protein
MHIKTILDNVASFLVEPHKQDSSPHIKKLAWVTTIILGVGTLGIVQGLSLLWKKIRVNPHNKADKKINQVGQQVLSFPPIESKPNEQVKLIIKPNLEEKPPNKNKDCIGERTQFALKFVENLDQYNSTNNTVRYQDQEYTCIRTDTISFSKTKLISVGSHFDREMITLDPNSLILNRCYDDFFHAIKEHCKNSKSTHLSMEIIMPILKKHVRNQIFPSCTDKSVVKNVDNFVKKYKQDNPDKCITVRNDSIPIISIDEFIEKGLGVCRHHALITAYLLDRLIQEQGGKLVPLGIVQHMRDNLDKGGAHVWINFTEVSKRKWHIDTLWNLGLEFTNPKSKISKFLAEKYGPKTMKNQRDKTDYAFELMQNNPQTYIGVNPDTVIKAEIPTHQSLQDVAQSIYNQRDTLWEAAKTEATKQGAVGDENVVSFFIQKIRNEFNKENHSLSKLSENPAGLAILFKSHRLRLAVLRYAQANNLKSLLKQHLDYVVNDFSHRKVKLINEIKELAKERGVKESVKIFEVLINLVKKDFESEGYNLKELYKYPELFIFFKQNQLLDLIVQHLNKKIDDFSKPPVSPLSPEVDHDKNQKQEAIALGEIHAKEGIDLLKEFDLLHLIDSPQELLLVARQKFKKIHQDKNKDVKFAGEFGALFNVIKEGNIKVYRRIYEKHHKKL